MMETSDNEMMPINRVNSHMLAQNVQKPVLLVAELLSIENLNMKIKCCDGSIIKALLHEPIVQVLAPGTKIQVLATPKSRTVVQCNDFIVLNDPDNDFDMKMYNDAVVILAEQENMNTYYITDVEEHWGSTNEKEIQLIFGKESDKDQPGNQPGDSNEKSKPIVDDSFF